MQEVAMAGAGISGFKYKKDGGEKDRSGRGVCSRARLYCFA
ncbi:MAG: hypothetical protein R6U54_02570 [Candidatus Omnitrophota bacterium]